MVYDGIKFYGPYLRKDGRKHLVYKLDGKHKSLSYPKYLMECHLDRYLEDWETVDHIDEDFTNDDINNLRVISRLDNIARSVKRNHDLKMICPECNKDFIVSGNKINNVNSNSKKGKAGPFCGKSCAGKYGQKIQVGELDKIDPIQHIKPKKYKNSDFEK